MKSYLFLKQIRIFTGLLFTLVLLNLVYKPGATAPAALPMLDEFPISSLNLTGFSPDVAYNSIRDEYLVVWGNPYDICGQLVSSRGELIGDEFIIAANSNKREMDPAVAYDSANNRYLVVWSREYSTTPVIDYEIYGRFIPWSGVSPIYSEFIIDNSTNNSVTPQVAYALAQGEFLVVWENWPATGDHTVWGRRVYANGSGFPDISKQINVSGNRRNPALSYNLARNEYLVVYDDLSLSSTNENVYGVILAGDGTALHGGEFSIANNSDEDELKPAVAACNSADRYLVAFQADHTTGPALYIRYVDGNGTLDGNVYQVDNSTPGYPYGEVEIACRWGLHYFLAWEHWDSVALKTAIWGQLWYPDETSDSRFEIAPATPYRADDPAVAGGSTSPNFLVAWQKDDGSGYADVYGTVLGDTKPDPDFSYTPSSGDTNTTFQFDASSSTDYEDAAADLQVRWDWQSDAVYDTAWSTTKTASHKFPTDGTHSVTLQVKDTYGLTNTITKQVVVGNASPVAAFTVSPSVGDNSTYFVFDPTGSTDNEDPTSALQVRWDWENDGTWDTSWDAMQTSGVTFGAAGYGLQTIVLEVKDTGGLTDSTTGTVLIDHAPTAAFTVTPTSGDTNTVFQFDASNTTDPDYGVYWLSVRWDWQDDGTYDTGWDGATKIVEHTFSQPGTYTVRMEVRQFDGSLTDSTTRNVTVTQGISNTAPTAAFTVTPTFGDTTTTFQFDASASSDSEDPTAALQVRWDFNGDGSFDTTWGTSKTATYTYSTTGTYTVRLEVKDTGGLNNSTTRNVTVTPASGNMAPIAAFTVTPTFGDTTTIFRFDASASSDGEDPIAALQVRWDFNDDGSFDTNWGTGKTTTHTYAAAGTYTVRLEIMDTGGLVDSTTRSIQVRLPGAPIPIYLPLVGRWVP